MKKKTENLGKSPKGFPYDFDVFCLMFFELVLPAYHAKRQRRRSHLDGVSPNEKFASFLTGDAPWRSRTLALDYGRFRCGPRLAVKCGQGGTFSVEGVSYRCEEALKHSAVSRLWVAVPLFGDRSRLPVFFGKEVLGVAAPVVRRAWNDPAGAVEWRHLTAKQRQQYRAGMERMPAVARLGAWIGVQEPAAQARPAPVVPFEPHWHRATQALAALPADEPEIDPLEQAAAEFDRKYGLRGTAARAVG
jgi:hypothetical protein